MYTCFSQWQEYSRSETNDCKPHISRHLSFRMMAITVQIPGWWATPVLHLFQWSLRVTRQSSICSRSGALDSSSSIIWAHLKSIIVSTGIPRKSDDFSFFLWQSPLHSWLRVPNNCVTMAALTPSIDSATLAIEVEFLPSKARASLPSTPPNSAEYGSWRDGVATVTLKFNFIKE